MCNGEKLRHLCVYVVFTNEAFIISRFKFLCIQENASQVVFMVTVHIIMIVQIEMGLKICL